MKPIKGLLLISIIAISLLRCTSPAPPPYRYHEVKGFAAFFTAVPVNHTAVSGSDSGIWTTVPLRAHEVLVAVGDQTPYLVRGSKNLPDSLYFRRVDSLVFLNDKLYGLVIHDRYNLLPFFSQMQQNELRELKSISITGPIPDSYLLWLDSIGKINPEIDFFIEGDSLDFPATQVNWISQHFTPRFLGIEMHPKDYALLSNFKHLESLYLMSNSDTLPHQPERLPAIPSLQYLTIALDESLNDIDARFLTLNPQLVSISMESHYGKVPLVSQLPPGLRSLYLYDDDSLRWLPNPEKLPRLTTLSINQPISDTLPLTSLLAFDQLRELGLPSGMPQHNFDTVIGALDRLSSLSILFDDTLLVTDYSKLSSLKHLKHLVITGKHGSVNPLKQLSQLDFLSLPEEFFEDTASLSSLRQALPETRIAPNGGFCMGTGWILLGIPGILLSWLFWRTRQKLIEYRTNISKP